MENESQRPVEGEKEKRHLEGGGEKREEEKKKKTKNKKRSGE